MTTFKEHSQSVAKFIQGLLLSILILSNWCLGINKEVQRIGKANDAISRIKKDQARTITRTFQNVLVDFNTEQVSYKEKCEERISTYLSIGKFHDEYSY